MAINLTNFINEVDLDYPRDEVFKIFRKQAKQEFPRFNEKEAIGTSTRKRIGAYSTRSAEAYVEISDYIPNEVYEVTIITSKTNTTFKSRYEFKDLENGGTHLTLIEDQGTPGVFSSINTIIQKLLFKGRVNKKFGFFIEGLKREIEGERKRINPKYVSPYDSEIAADENPKIEEKKESIAP